LTSTKRGSVREEVSKAGFGIFCAIAEGIIKGFCKFNIVHPSFETQTLIHSKDVSVWSSVCRVIPCDVLLFPGKERDKDNRKLDHPAV
jgi:hypothetical protein